MRTNVLSSIVLLWAAVAAGCSATRETSTFGEGTSGAGGSGDTSGGTTGGGAGGADTTGIVVDGGAGGGAPQPLVAQVFAHSESTLYRLDPDTKAASYVADFDGCSSVIDIAIDKDGVMFGTTFDGLWRIDPKTAKCSQVASGDYPNSLSFVPKGTLDPAKEALVGYVGADYVRIDEVTGAVTTVGSLGTSKYQSSGDIVSVIGGGTYLTIKGNDCADCIVEVDPTTGAMKSMIGNLDHGSVFGLAFWGGVAYGFDDAGTLFEIDLSNASTKAIAMPGAPSGLSFWGAGSTTAAPLVTPK
jgi:hypothetical protein